MHVLNYGIHKCLWEGATVCLVCQGRGRMAVVALVSYKALLWIRKREGGLFGEWWHHRCANIIVVSMGREFWVASYREEENCILVVGGKKSKLISDHSELDLWLSLSFSVAGQQELQWEGGEHKEFTFLENYLERSISLLCWKCRQVDEIAN